MATAQQQQSKPSDEQNDESLKNGTSLDDSDDSSAPPSTKGSFQPDGGQSNNNSQPYYNYNQQQPDYNQENAANYNHEYSRYDDGKMYPQQYNQMRAGYPPRPRGPPYSNSNSNAGQRFLSGPALSQQTGPTPTLNQLLQAPNSMQRYHNSYDYAVPQKDQYGQQQGPNSSWGRGPPSQFPQQQQQMPSSMYRNQGGGQMDQKRNYGNQGQYPGQQYYPQQSQGHRQPYTPQQGVQQQYSNMPPQQSGYEHPQRLQQSWPQQQQQSPQQSQQQQQQQPHTQQQPPSHPQQQPPSHPQQPQMQPQQQTSPHPQQTSQTPPSAQQPPQHQPYQSQPQQPPPQQPMSQQQPQQIPQQQQPHQSPQHQPHQSPQHQPHQSPQHMSQTQQTPPQQHQPQQPQTVQDGGGSSEESGGPEPSTTPAPGLRTPPHPPAPSPTPSPSMSPALGQQGSISMPPRPSSTQPEGGTPPQPSTTPQGYNQQMAPPGMYGNKMHQNMMAGSSPHMPPYSPQHSGHYPQSGYHRPPMHSYGSSSGPPNSYPGYQPPHRAPPPPSGYPSGYGSQYPPNAVAPPQQQQAAPQQGGYAMNNMMPPPNQYPKANMPPPGPGAQAAAQAAVIAAAATSGGNRPLYLRQHLQQKGYNSEPMPPPPHSAPTDFGSASSAAPASSTLGLPPSNTTQSIPSPAPSGVGPAQSPSLVPPPGALDEGSQASTASEGRETPKPRPMMSHPPTPNTLPSPGAASMSSFHDDFESVSSPSWPRTPASPVVNNASGGYGSEHPSVKRPDGMLKLYEMSEEPERRTFLDKLIAYQDERGTPISQCPTISKQPLDLYRLYTACKERGGFVEVMKGKMWKEIAGLIGIGASSSAAYTLRKQYIKHLLPFECKYDRGGIDPAPLISSLESATRKKNQAKNAGGQIMDGYPYPGGYPPNPNMMGGGEYPHPGYQDSMGHHPMVNHSNSEGPMDPFGDDAQYPPRHNASEGYGYSQSNSAPYPSNPPNASPGSFGYGSAASQPQSEPYGGSSEPYQGSAGEPGYAAGRPPASTDPYGPPPGGYPPNRTIGPGGAATTYPPYQGPAEQERFGDSGAPPPVRAPAPSSSVIAPPPDGAAPYRYPAREGYPGGNRYPAPYPQQDSYRAGNDFQPQMSRLQSTLIQRLLPKNQNSQNYSSSQGGMYGGGQGGPPNKVAPSSGGMYQRDVYPMGPKRPHDQWGPSYPQQQQQPPYSDRSQYPYRPTHGGPSTGPGPQQVAGWPRDRQYGGSGGPLYPQQRDGWDGGQPPGGWSGPRYGGPQSEPYPHHMGQKMMHRGYPPNKMPPPQYGQQQGAAAARREVTFPPDTVEGVTAVASKRRRLTAKDVAPIDPWRLMMALKSGLLGEATWALDTLAILVHDDATVLYFGLSHLQGMLEVLMDHYRRCLNFIFDDLVGDMEVGFMLAPTEDQKPERKWYELDGDCDNSSSDKSSSGKEKDVLKGPKTLFLDTTNYTFRSRCKKPVHVKDDEALFLLDPEKRWDTHEGFISGSSHWQHGGGEYTGFVQTHFESSERRVPFVRRLRDVCKQNSVGEKDDAKPAVDTSSDGKSIDTRPEATDINKPIVNGERTANGVVSDKETSCSEIKTSENNKSDNDSSSNLEAEEFPRLRQTLPCKRRRSTEDLEDESHTRDEPSLCTETDARDSLLRRCTAVSTILRNLSFVPGNDTEMSKHAGFLLVMGRLLLLHHVHPPRRPPQRHYDRDEESADGVAAADAPCSSLASEHEWWWEALHALRENTLVTLANVSGQLDLSPFPEEISFSILDGLLHWATCPSSYARDPLPTPQAGAGLSPRRFALEALCKLSVLEGNVDLLAATPPWHRTDRLLRLLAGWLSPAEEAVLREFSVVLLFNLAQAGSGVARAIALQPPAVPLLLTFVELAEQSALQVANAKGIHALREQPELMGTTLDMVRRAAGTLRFLARVPANRPLFVRHQSRLLALVMSQILDQGVAAIVADILFECSQGAEETGNNSCS